MNSILQTILIIGSICFFIFVMLLVKKSKLQVKYSLIWFLLATSYLVIAIFPEIVGLVASVLYIQEKVNALYLITIFFIIVICFVYNLILSKQSEKIRHLIQEVSMLRSEINSQNKKND